MSQTERVAAYLKGRHSTALNLVTTGAFDASVPLQDACDAVYSLVLLGRAGELTTAGAQAFVRLAKGRRLAGGLNAPTTVDAAPAVVHLTAYVLGTLALYRDAGFDVAAELLDAERWDFDALFHKDGLPRWPAKWSHHGWRVSHWIGGAPSILYNLRRLLPAKAAAQGAPELTVVLAASDRLVDPRTGWLKCYKSDLVQKAFRALYRLRHDPDAGDVGGVVHLHWVNWASGRIPYMATAELFARAKAVYARAPFIEDTPYCLDFDVIQIVRTAAPTAADIDQGVKTRAAAFADDVAAFFDRDVPQTYGLHRLPGALATQHEAALILGESTVPHLGAPTVDIIKRAGWI